MSRRGSGRGNRGGGRQPFNYHANKLRETLENRISAAQDEQLGSENQDNRPADRERHPAHLKGRDIGLFYARRMGKKAEESILVSFLNFVSILSFNYLIFFSSMDQISH